MPLLHGTTTSATVKFQERSCSSVRSFGVTECGCVRATNEDQFAIVEIARTLNICQTSIPQANPQYSSHRGHLFIVADGVGGHRAGEIASALSVTTVEDFLLNSLDRFAQLEPSDEQTVLREFQHALCNSDARIFQESTRHPEWRGMGTTLTLALIVDQKLFVAHVGDSRCYLFAQDGLHQLTEDHTLVAEMVRAGILQTADAAHHPRRHVVTNVLGGHEQGAQVELHKLDLEPHDRILLCSDGLTEMVTDDTIAEVLREQVQPQRVCECLVEKAVEAGGKDNITVVVAEFLPQAERHVDPICQTVEG